jgi:hypothetical protein
LFFSWNNFFLANFTGFSDGGKITEHFFYEEIIFEKINIFIRGSG